MGERQKEIQSIQTTTICDPKAKITTLAAKRNNRHRRPSHAAAEKISAILRDRASARRCKGQVRSEMLRVAPLMSKPTSAACIAEIAAAALDAAALADVGDEQMGDVNARLQSSLVARLNRQKSAFLLIIFAVCKHRDCRRATRRTQKRRRRHLNRRRLVKKTGSAAAA